MNKKHIAFVRNLLPYLPVILAPIILFFWPLFSGRAFYWGLPSLQFIPWRVYAGSLIQDGILPLWNALNGMGAPLLANYQLALFYPPSWLLYVLYLINGAELLAWGHTLLLVLHLIWGGIGFARLMKRFGYSELSQSLTGTVFSICSFFIARAGFFSMVWTAVWLPWIFNGAEALVTKPQSDKQYKWEDPVTLTVYIALMLLAGHAQLSWYILEITGLWIFVSSWYKQDIKYSLSRIVRFIVVVIFASLISSIQLLPTAEYLLNSYRSASLDFISSTTYSFWPWRLLTFVSPDLFGNPRSGDYWGYAAFWEDAVYIGIFPLILSLSTIGEFIRNKITKLNKLRIVFFWSMAILGILLALGKNTPIFTFLYNHVPSFDMFNAPSRYMIWTVFSLIVLFGIAVDSFTNPTGKRLYWFRLGTAGAFALCVGTFLAWKYIDNIQVTFIRSVFIAGVFACFSGLLLLYKPAQIENKKAFIWKIAVTLLIMVDLGIAGWNATPTVDKDYYFENQKITENNTNNHGDKRIYISNKDDYWLRYSRILRFQDYRQLEDINNLKIIMVPNINLLSGTSYVNNFDPLLPDRYYEWMDRLQNYDEKKAAPWLKLMDVGLLEVSDPNEPLGVSYKEIQSSSRFRWIPCGIFLDNKNDAWDKLSNIIIGQENQIDKIVVLESDRENGNLDTCDITQKGDVKIISDRINILSIEINSNADGWVLVSDVWYPGWNCYIDGNKTEIYIGDYLFKAVEVPAGNHTVELRYQPISFYSGAIISGLSIIFIMIMSFKGNKTSSN